MHTVGKTVNQHWFLHALLLSLYTIRGVHNELSVINAISKPDVRK